MKKIFLPLLFSWLCFCLHAQTSCWPGIAAQGGNWVTTQGLNALTGNPAGLKAIERTVYALASSQRYGLPELSSAFAGVVTPLTDGAIGLSIEQFGFQQAYREQSLAVAYARPLDNKLTLGARFQYLGQQVQEVGRTGGLAFQLGLLAAIREELHLGVAIGQGRREQTHYGRQQTLMMGFGLAYQPSEKVKLQLMLEKQLEVAPQLRLGFRYHWKNRLWLMGGFTSTPLQSTFGLGFQLRPSIRLETALQWHQPLGWTPSLSLFGTLGKEK